MGSRTALLLQLAAHIPVLGPHVEDPGSNPSGTICSVSSPLSPRFTL